MDQHRASSFSGKVHDLEIDIRAGLFACPEGFQDDLVHPGMDISIVKYIKTEGTEVPKIIPFPGNEVSVLQLTVPYAANGLTLSSILMDQFR